MTNNDEVMCGGGPSWATVKLPDDQNELEPNSLQDLTDRYSAKLQLFP